MVQLDTSASTSGLAFSAPGTSGTIVEMWDYDSATECPEGPGVCGDAHVIDAGFPVVSSAYGDATHLGPDETVQMRLFDGVQTKVGEFVVECGTASGTVTVDVLNALDMGADAGARLFFGFGANIDGTPITTWTAANADIAGNSIELECVGGPEVTLESSDPLCDVSLTRAADNCFRLTFDGPITAPAAGEILIQELLDGGAVGADLSASFTYTVEGGNVLKIAENGDVFSNGTWYGVFSGTWGGVAAFEVDYRVVYGDVDSDGTTGGLDANDIWGARGAAQGECDKYDIDADGNIGGLDANDAWGNRGSTAGPKPTGHGCLP
jgi:hypothetical protein